MSDKERIIQAIDIISVIVLSLIGCLVGQLVMERYDNWFGFNGPAIGVLIIGELIWWRIRKQLIRKWKDE